MSDAGGEERRLLESAMSRTDDCLSPETLATQLVGGGTVNTQQQEHVAGCTYCQTELKMLEEFQTARPTEREAGDVAWIAEQLKANPPIPWTSTESQDLAAATPTSGVKGLLARLRTSFGTNPFAITSWAAATVAILVAGGLYVQQMMQPGFSIGDDGRPVTFRSGRVDLLSPRGDLDALPTSFEWNSIEGAARYEIEVLEVDRTVVWRSDSELASIAVPGEVETLAVPGKTLWWRVRALDTGGRELAVSSREQFRISVSPSAP